MSAAEPEPIGIWKGDKRPVSREHWDTLYRAHRKQTDSWLELYDLLVDVRRDLAAQGATAEGLPGVLPQTLFRITKVLERGT